MMQEHAHQRFRNNFCRLLSWRLVPLLLLVGCAAVLDFGPEGLPCDVANGQACLANYSCNVEDPNVYRCIGDRSLKEGDKCQLDRQCPTDLICPTGINRCLKVCPLDNSYVPGAGCPAQSYCRPALSVGMFSDGGVHEPQQVAACAPSDGCKVGESCTTPSFSGGMCASMGTATACVVSCETKFTANKYSDNCGTSVKGGPRFCQPLGVAAGEFVLACLDTGPTPQPNGAACANPVSQPCAPGSGCINQVCRAYTNLSLSPSTSCGGTLQACELHLNASQIIGYCIDKCPD